MELIRKCDADHSDTRQNDSQHSYNECNTQHSVFNDECNIFYCYADYHHSKCRYGENCVLIVMLTIILQNGITNYDRKKFYNTGPG